MPGVTWTEGRPAGTLDTGVFALFSMPIPVEGATVWADPTAAYSERVALATGWNPGHPAPGGVHDFLFGVIILRQPTFLSSADTFAERTVTSGSWAERTI